MDRYVVLQLTEQLTFIFNVHLNENFKLMRVKEFNARPKKHFRLKLLKEI